MPTRHFHLRRSNRIMEIRNTSLRFLLHKVIFLKAYFKTVYLFLFTVNFPSVLPPSRWNPLLLLAEYHLPIVLTSHLIELHFHFFFSFLMVSRTRDIVLFLWTYFPSKRFISCRLISSVLSFNKDSNFASVCSSSSSISHWWLPISCIVFIHKSLLSLSSSFRKHIFHIL